jgi:hypothetical protein
MIPALNSFLFQKSRHLRSALRQTVFCWDGGGAEFVLSSLPARLHAPAQDRHPRTKNHARVENRVADNVNKVRITEGPEDAERLSADYRSQSRT